MSFDLQKMLHRKGEFETARLDDFAFRARARTMRLLAAALDLVPEDLVALIATMDDDAILDRLTRDSGFDRQRIDADYCRARSSAGAALRRELGDPSPVRLA
ncbi:hypothetical protein [Sphingomonas sp.]|uniref:hypothetical protein n=1 Tax=Sphingomonas sp. TaxID=28214 RepID=UPI003D6CBD82